MYAEAKLLMEKELLLNAAKSTCQANASPNFVNHPRFCLCHSCCSGYTPQTAALFRSDFLRKLEQMINMRASILAKEYLASLGETQILSEEKLSFQKVFLVLKFSETPENVLLEGMKLIGNSDQTRSYFKSLAKMVHPDKNGHPLAKTVFQKLSNATELALKSMSAYDPFKMDTRMNAANYGFDFGAAAPNASY